MLKSEFCLRLLHKLYDCVARIAIIIDILCVCIITCLCRPNSGQLISQTVEMFVHACSSHDQHIRIAASENLKKLIKVCPYLFVAVEHHGVVIFIINKYLMFFQSSI